MKSDGRSALGTLLGIAAVIDPGGITRRALGVDFARDYTNDDDAHPRTHKEATMDLYGHTNGTNRTNGTAKDRRPLGDQLTEAKTTIDNLSGRVKRADERLQERETHHNEAVRDLNKTIEEERRNMRVMTARATFAEQAVVVANKQIEALKATIANMVGAIAVPPVAVAATSELASPRRGW